MAMKRPEDLTAFELEVRQAASQYDCQHSPLLTSDFGADGLSDDTVGMSLNNAQDAANLKERFLHRLAAIVCGSKEWNSPTIALMREDTVTESVTIWLAMSSIGGARDSSIGHSMADLLTRIHRRTMTEDRHDDCQATWNLIFRCYRSRIETYVKAIHPVLQQISGLVDDLVTDVLGAIAEIPHKLDHEVTNRLIKLHNLVCTSIAELNTEYYKSVIQVTSELYELPFCEGRLKSVLGSTLAKKLFPHVRLLVQPRQAFNTIVRAAQALETFNNVSVRLGIPSFGRTSPPSMPPPETRATFWPTSNEPSKRIQAFRAAPKIFTAVRPADHPVEQFARLLKKARHYLDPQEQNVGQAQLSPSAKRWAFLLMAAVDDKKTPDPVWESYHMFGFSACQNEDQRQRLGGLYYVILNTCGDRIATFDELWRSAMSNNLVAFFDRHGYSNFREYIPGLEHFLQPPARRRESVFRLVQFIHSDRPFPYACLQRDYGYSLCQGQEVAVLKAIHRDLLAKLGPLGLHEACLRGELLEAADALKLNIGHKNRRLLRNKYPMPNLGYEDTETA